MRKTHRSENYNPHPDNIDSVVIQANVLNIFYSCLGSCNIGIDDLCEAVSLSINIPAGEHLKTYESIINAIYQLEEDGYLLISSDGDVQLSDDLTHKRIFAEAHVINICKATNKPVGIMDTIEAIAAITKIDESDILDAIYGLAEQGEISLLTRSQVIELGLVQTAFEQSYKGEVFLVTNEN